MLVSFIRSDVALCKELIIYYNYDDDYDYYLLFVDRIVTITLLHPSTNNICGEMITLLNDFHVMKLTETAVSPLGSHLYQYNSPF